VRRLAKYSRHDKVRSRRDYQVIREYATESISLVGNEAAVLVFESQVQPSDTDALIGVGMFVQANKACRLQLSVAADTGETSQTEVHVGTRWTRAGLTISAPAASKTRLTLLVPEGPRRLDVWGLDCGRITLPDAIRNDPEAQDTAKLMEPHLVPETFYLQHDAAIAMDPRVEDWLHALRDEQGPTIQLKKCAYCGRLLPIDTRRRGALSFHKHNAKVTRHQNECRACKKWRINDAFNPDRTKDQLHESSVITRERKLFLREPEILQSIKDREGAGLKSIIWDRFGRKCFRCKDPLELWEVRIDHTRPMAYLWPIDQYATCLCEPCNNYKRERFPVDVYTDDQLRELSAITGLPVAELRKKEVNEQELQRVLSDIGGFAQQVDPRMLNATARKVRELRPDIDLMAILRARNPKIYAEVCVRLLDRPED
jgi:hypothetical protein